MFSPLIVNQVPPPGVDTDPRAFCPALLHGEKVQGFMTTKLGLARMTIEPFSHDHQTAERIRLRLYVFFAVQADILIKSLCQGKRSCVVSFRQIRHRIAETFDRGIGPQY